MLGSQDRSSKSQPVRCGGNAFASKLMKTNIERRSQGADVPCVQRSECYRRRKVPQSSKDKKRSARPPSLVRFLTKRVMSVPIIPSDSADMDLELLDVNNSRNLMAKAGSMFAICALAVLLRCHVRVAILKSFGADDWTMLLAFVSYVELLFQTVLANLRTGFRFCCVYMLCLGSSKWSWQRSGSHTIKQSCVPGVIEDDVQRSGSEGYV